jgi:hypothetical protein
MQFASVIPLVVIVAADPKPGEEGTPEFERAAALVKQLGHPRFAVREAAARDLVELGATAVPALSAGTKSKDQEVRTRCEALLPQAKAAEWKRRADAYVAKPDEKHDLPLLAEWDTLIGKPDAGSRKLFAEMIRTNGGLLDAAAGDPKAVRDAVKARCRTVLNQVLVGREQVPASVGDLAALFFVHSRVENDRPTWVAERAEWDADHPTHLLANPAVGEALNARDVGPPLCRVIAAWAASRPADDQVSHQCFCLSVHEYPFPEAVPVLAKLAKDGKAQPLNVRAPAVSALGAVGDGPAQAALAELVSDSTPLFRMSGHELGDHALATLLQAQHKKVDDYGLSEIFECRFKSARTKGAAIPLKFLTFPNGDARKNGVEKWKAETAKKNK